MKVFINRCQFEQNEWFQKRNQAIFILTNIFVQPSMLIAYIDVYKNNNEIVISCVGQFPYITEEENLDKEDLPTEVMVLDEPLEYWNTLSR